MDGKEPGATPEDKDTEMEQMEEHKKRRAVVKGKFSRKVKLFKERFILKDGGTAQVCKVELRTETATYG